MPVQILRGGDRPVAFQRSARARGAHSPADSLCCGPAGGPPAAALLFVETTPPEAWRGVPLPELLARLVAHHAAMREAIPRLAGLGARVARVHGSRHPGLSDLVTGFSGLVGDAVSHFDHEEQLFFPLVLRLGEGFDFPLDVLARAQEAEHEEAAWVFGEMRRLACGYEASPDACAGHRALLEGLRELEDAMRRHVRLESEVLFPRVRELLGA